jgi:hypothetical protein
MQYVVAKENRTKNLVMLQVNLQVVSRPGVLFSDCNATRADAIRSTSPKIIRFDVVQQKDQFAVAPELKKFYQAEVLVPSPIPPHLITFPLPVVSNIGVSSASSPPEVTLSCGKNEVNSAPASVATFHAGRSEKIDSVRPAFDPMAYERLRLHREWFRDYGFDPGSSSSGPTGLTPPRAREGAGFDERVKREMREVSAISSDVKICDMHEQKIVSDSLSDSRNDSLSFLNLHSTNDYVFQELVDTMNNSITTTDVPIRSSGRLGVVGSGRPESVSPTSPEVCYGSSRCEAWRGDRGSR